MVALTDQLQNSVFTIKLSLRKLAARVRLLGLQEWKSERVCEAGALKNTWLKVSTCEVKC